MECRDGNGADISHSIRIVNLNFHHEWHCYIGVSWVYAHSSKHNIVAIYYQIVARKYAHCQLKLSARIILKLLEHLS